MVLLMISAVCCRNRCFSHGYCESIVPVFRKVHKSYICHWFPICVADSRDCPSYEFQLRLIICCLFWLKLISNACSLTNTTLTWEALCYVTQLLGFNNAKCNLLLEPTASVMGMGILVYADRTMKNTMRIVSSDWVSLSWNQNSCVLHHFLWIQHFPKFDEFP